MRWISRGVISGWTATSCAIAGRRRRQAPSPWIGSWSRARSAAQRGSSRSIRSGSRVRRTTLARGSRCVVMPMATRVRMRSGWRLATCSAVIAPIENPSRWNVSMTEGVGEGQDVVDEHRRREAVGGVPARAPVAARIGQVRQERLREHRQLGGEVGASGGAAAVEHHERRPGAEHVVADLEAVGADGGHPGDDATAGGPPKGRCGDSQPSVLAWHRISHRPNAGLPAQTAP